MLLHRTCWMDLRPAASSPPGSLRDELSRFSSHSQPSAMSWPNLRWTPPASTLGSRASWRSELMPSSELDDLPMIRWPKVADHRQLLLAWKPTVSECLPAVRVPVLGSSSRLEIRPPRDWPDPLTKRTKTDGQEAPDKENSSAYDKMN